MPNRFASLASPQSLAAMLAVVAVLAATAAPTQAKPKKQLINGCTAEQVQSPAARQCIDKTSDDLIHDRATVHRLYCSSSGTMMCCEYDQAGNTVDHSCETLNMSRPKYDIMAPNTGTLAPQSLTESGGDDGPAAPPAGGVTIF